MDKKIYIIEDCNGDWTAHSSFAETQVECLRRYSAFLNSGESGLTGKEIINDISDLVNYGYIGEMIYIHTVIDMRKD